MRKLLVALLLVAAAAYVTVPRLGGDDDVVVTAAGDTDVTAIARTLEARLASAGLEDVEVERSGTRVSLGPVEDGTRDLVRALTGAYRLHLRPVDGTCDTAASRAATDPAASVELPVRPPAEPPCLRLGAAVASNESVRHAQASGTNVVIRFGALSLETRSEWAIEVDGEVLAAPRVAERLDDGVEMVVDALSRPAALALAAGLVHPLPGALR